MSNANNSHINRDLDLSHTRREVWLVKVPKYVANRWDKSLGTNEVGKLKISRLAGQKSQVQLSLSEAELCLEDSGEQSIPKEHRLDVSYVTRQSLGVFSHAIPSDSDAVIPESEKLYMEGRIVQKLECRPHADSVYYKRKSESITKASIPQRQVQRLARIEPKFKPIVINYFLLQIRLKKKFKGKKYRDDIETVLISLFAAFEKHQYYNIRDLHKITNQPMKYLKTVMKDICNYNLKNPHKYMWELKPEYRHYKQESLNEMTENNGSDSD
ncbi:general transcription factor IIF subunit 2-like [Achroia grisella]|uniref:general transcription factor IIF subunit 2-like n=1 Tax=Achroia grisella TaxID=688607 RepID=UPI0027D33F41|nr:general transcription factor IIF subunit 2-like [Achroia grisella]